MRIFWIIFNIIFMFYDLWIVYTDYQEYGIDWRTFVFSATAFLFLILAIIQTVLFLKEQE